ncbi:glycoside hydrolase family 15 protein [Kribbella qitaiheensis]|uniref:glycoside hydrolase family 15 protein n=1 Tax=Kribbella qitaiheensis TaxID=1544730 RepID=UPI00360BA462
MTQQIEDYALIGDLRTAALVGVDGSVDWLCLPRFDSPAVFATLLGDTRNGRWILAPQSGGRCTRRRYRGDSLILDTEWITPDGAVRVTDFMSPTSAGPQVVRIVEGLAGEVPMHMCMAPRMDYGKVVPSLHSVGGHFVGTAGPDSVWLRSDVALTATNDTLTGDFVVSAGQQISFTFGHLRSSQLELPTVDAADNLAATERYWLQWMSKCTYSGPWADAVKRSLIILKALTFAPTGGIVAAATTSLPEQIGGSRNWDYRFCWLRDAAFTVRAFLATGYVEEASAWRDWLLRTVAGDPTGTQIMYAIDGTRHLPELTLDWLPGHAASRPVRIGNGAATQRQNDVWGEVLDALHATRAAEDPPRPDEADLERGLVTQLEQNWAEPDNGIWEIRGPQRHFVHSKLMAWVGVDRAVCVLENDHTSESLNELRELREAIRTEICNRGFSQSRRAFTQSYGSARLDASVLLMPRYGFLPWADPRMVATVDAIQRNLTRDGLVLRYAVGAEGTNVDGIHGEEGAFLACSFWLADALHGIGRTDEAAELFDRLLSLRNDVGLLSEEYDPITGRHLGNTPQALSHAGLVTTALHLAKPTATTVQHHPPTWQEAAS